MTFLVVGVLSDFGYLPLYCAIEVAKQPWAAQELVRTLNHGEFVVVNLRKHRCNVTEFYNSLKFVDLAVISPIPNTFDD